MKISLLCTDENHPVNSYLDDWIKLKRDEHEFTLVHKKTDLKGGDVLFLISCAEIIDAPTRSKFNECLVLHCSDLPRGRGWSPHVWEIISGANQVTLCLLEAEDKVDSGRIWNKVTIEIPRNALWYEIDELIFLAEIKLLDITLSNFDQVKPIAQDPYAEPSYWPKRTPLDSEIDVHKSIASQFDQIRVCNPERYPAFFDFRGSSYKLYIEKIS